MKKIILMIPVLAISACSSSNYRSDGSLTRGYYEDLKSKYISEQCDSSSLVGESSGIKLLVDAKRHELESLKASLDFSTYSSLSQKLEGYSVEWEILNKELERACKKDAACRFDYNERNSQCSHTNESYSNSRKDMLDFVSKVNTLKIK